MSPFDPDIFKPLAGAANSTPEISEAVPISSGRRKSQCFRHKDSGQLNRILRGSGRRPVLARAGAGEGSRGRLACITALNE
jgi:hypothetical protein